MQQSSPEQPARQQEPLPEAREVAAGIWKITLPIPFPLRTVNMYALAGNHGWALVDAGMGIPEARTAFTAALHKAGLSIDTLDTIVLSHHHPDHVGLSGELQEQSGAAVYMHPIDEAAIQIIWAGTMPQKFGRVSRFLSQHGLPPSELWFTQVDPQAMRNIIHVPPHETITLVEDGQYIDLVGERYRVIWTPGHSDGHICLFRERDGIFLAADHVLPRITPNIGLYSQYDRVNPLGDYLDSLRKVSTLPASIVLPGHGEPFKDLA
ncbi:MAG TPA: MBL fold metallo-hydrolase, partial [Ktedonobacteraceae bacterium]|nr:MBL fold metallo-hydrolase [Ktedonobacteraceae bacterium]